MAYKKEPWTLDTNTNKEKSNQLSSVEKVRDKQVETNYSLSVKLGVHHSVLQKVLNKLVKKKVISIVPFKRKRANNGYIITPENLQIIKKELRKKSTPKKSKQKKVKRNIFTFTLFGWKITISH